MDQIFLNKYFLSDSCIYLCALILKSRRDKSTVTSFAVANLLEIAKHEFPVGSYRRLEEGYCAMKFIWREERAMCTSLSQSVTFIYRCFYAACTNFVM